MKPSDLLKKEYDNYFKLYINQVPELDLLEALEYSQSNLMQVLNSLSEEKANFKYAEGKWTIKELLIHLIDTERIFCYRALWFARKDNAILIGYDQDEFILFSEANNRSLKSLIEEYLAQRKSTIVLFKNMTNEMFKRIGEVEENQLSVRAIAFMLVGHDIHHTKILKERYFSK